MTLFTHHNLNFNVNAILILTKRMANRAAESPIAVKVWLLFLLVVGAAVAVALAGAGSLASAAFSDASDRSTFKSFTTALSVQEIFDLGVMDLDADGAMEILASAFQLTCSYGVYQTLVLVRDPSTGRYAQRPEDYEQHFNFL